MSLFDLHLKNFEIITTKLCHSLQNDLPQFDEAEFFKMFGGKLEDNLSMEGKALYKSELTQNVLSTILKESHEKLQQVYKTILSAAETEIQTNFDPTETENSAQNKLKSKLERIKQDVYPTLIDTLRIQNQVFNNPADEKELSAAFSDYWNIISKKYNNNVRKINLIWSKLAALKLHIRNEEKKLRSKNSATSFAVNEIDLDKLSIGVAPEPTHGWKIDIPNLKERLLYKLANQKADETFHIIVTVPDRNGITRQIGEIGFQCRSPAVALLALLTFYLLAIICNNDIERMVTAFEAIIKQDGIAIDPNKINYTLKQCDNHGKSTVIKEKLSLSLLQTTRLHKANQALKENFKKEYNAIKKMDSSKEDYQSDAGYDSEEEQTSENSSMELRL